MTAKQCDLGFRLTLPPAAHRKIPRTREERRRSIEGALRIAVQGPAPYPSFAEFSREHGMHEQTIFRHFPRLSRELISRRARSLQKARIVEASRIEALIRKLIARDHRTLSKEGVRAISLTCKSSVCQVRKAWKRLSSATSDQ